MITIPLVLGSLDLSPLKRMCQRHAQRPSLGAQRPSGVGGCCASEADPSADHLGHLPLNIFKAICIKLKDVLGDSEPTLLTFSMDGSPLCDFRQPHFGTLRSRERRPSTSGQPRTSDQSEASDPQDDMIRRDIRRGLTSPTPIREACRAPDPRLDQPFGSTLQSGSTVNRDMTFGRIGERTSLPISPPLRQLQPHAFGHGIELLVIDVTKSFRNTSDRCTIKPE